MKQLFLLLLLISTMRMGAQNLEFTGQFYTESYGQRIIPYQGDKWFFAGKLFPGLWEGKEFTVIYGAINESGNLFPFSPIQEFDNSNALDLAQKGNGNILVAAEDFACNEEGNGVIYEINQLGQVINTYTFPSDCFDYLNIFPFQNNVYASCQEAVFQIMENGTVQPIISNVGQITGLIVLSPNSFLVSIQDDNIIKVNAQSTILNEINVAAYGDVLQMERLGNGKNVVLQEQRIKIFNDALQPINEVGVQNVNVSFQRLTSDGTNIWVLAEDLNNHILVYGFDHNLELTHDFIMESNGLIANDIASNNESVALVGVGNSGEYIDTLDGAAMTISAGRNLWIKSFDKSEVLEFQSADVSFDKITTDSASFEEISFYCQSTGDQMNGWKGSFKGLELTITNQGEEVLQSFEANVQVFACSSDCNLEEETLIRESYDNLFLSPGATAILPFPDFTANFSDMADPQLCMWLSVPNQHIDLNTDDNVFCKYFFETPVSVEEIEKTPYFKLLNNPVESYISFELMNIHSNEVTVSIYDMLGNRMLKHSFTNVSASYELELIDLSSGTYIIALEAAEKILETKRFVKI